MHDYRRAWHPGGTYFFAVNLLQRQGNDLLVRQVPRPSRTNPRFTLNSGHSILRVR
jgi:hypothetical protein